MPNSPLHQPIVDWYDEAARELPWRGPAATPWAVMVSEFMLQQTPVSRVLPVFAAWLDRWPTPRDLAASTAGDAVRAWGRLGYPRRALRLHASAVAIVADHDGQVPDNYAELKALPGVGDYTAAAIATFAYGRREVVLDTNVRRVLARLLSAREFPPEGAPTRAEREQAAAVLPERDSDAAHWSIALMELGALVCTASDPACHRCPVANQCAWLQAGRPAYDGPPRRGQTYAGTDRQCRGRILATIRDSDAPVPQSRIDLVWQRAEQRSRCLESLLADGLVVELDRPSADAEQRYALPR